MNKIYLLCLVVLVLNGCDRIGTTPVVVNTYLEVPIPLRHQTGEATEQARRVRVESYTSRGGMTPLEADVDQKIRLILMNEGFFISHWEPSLPFIQTHNTNQERWETLRRSSQPRSAGEDAKERESPPDLTRVAERARQIRDSISYRLTHSYSLRPDPETKELKLTLRLSLYEETPLVRVRPPLQKRMWSSEAWVIIRNNDEREALNYAIAASFMYFGKNTHQNVIVRLNQKNEYIKLFF